MGTPELYGRTCLNWLVVDDMILAQCLLPGLACPLESQYGAASLVDDGEQYDLIADARALSMSRGTCKPLH